MNEEMFQHCPLCGLDKEGGYEYSRIPEYLTYRVRCSRCGYFIASHEFYLFHQEGYDKHIISGLVREINERYQEDGCLKEQPEVLMKNLQSIFKNPAIPKQDDIDAKQEKILAFVKRRSKHLGDVVLVDYNLDYPIAYAVGKEELIAYLESLVDKKYLVQHENYQGNSIEGGKGYSLSEKGWKQAEKIIKNEKPINLPIEVEEEEAPTLEEAAPEIGGGDDDGDGNERGGEEGASREEEPDEENDGYAPTQAQRDLFKALGLHPEIAEASWRLFKDGHYRDAIYRAYVAINSAARDKAGITSGKDKSIMGMIFSEDKPILRINALQSESDLNEQAGFKHLFMGATVGIRNPKGHSNLEQRDPLKTLQYLSFASILMETIDKAEIVEYEDEEEEK